MEDKIQRIIKGAKDKTSWKNRIKALKEMQEIDFPQKKDLITQMAIHDKVFSVKEEAFRLAQSLGYKKNGKPIYL